MEDNTPLPNSKQPAFPDSYIEPGDEGSGLTKREYFAAMAMQGLIASQRKIQKDGYNVGEVGYGSYEYAKSAIAYADALLLELEKK